MAHDITIILEILFGVVIGFIIIPIVYFLFACMVKIMHMISNWLIDD